MQVEEIKNEGLSREYSVTIPANELNDKRDAKLKEYSKTIRMPGFRPGKVPLKIMQQKYGKAVLGEILEGAVNDSSEKVIQDKGIQPALQPKIEIKEFEEDKDLVYTISMEIIPDFSVSEYKGLKLEKPVASVSDEQIGDTLTRIASQRRTSKKVEEDREAKKGDIAVIDFKGRTADDNKEHPGMEANGHHLELGSGHFIPGFEDQLIGKKPGEKAEVKVTFPDEYQKDLAGRDAIFDVEIKEIREPVEAEINEQLAKDLGFDDLNGLKEAVKQQLQQEYDQFSRMKVKRALLDVLDEQHKFEVPEGMLDMEYKSIINQIEQDQKSSDEAESKLSDDEKAELKDIADRRVRLGLVLSKVGNENNISITEQELRAAVIKEAQKYPGQEREVFDFFQNTPQALESLRAPIFEDKVIDFILELSDISEKEVSPEELTAEDEESENKPEEKKQKKSTGKKKSTSTKKAGDKAEEAEKGADAEKPKAKKSSSKSSGGPKKTTKKS